MKYALLQCQSEDLTWSLIKHVDTLAEVEDEIASPVFPWQEGTLVQVANVKTDKPVRLYLFGKSHAQDIGIHSKLMHDLLKDENDRGWVEHITNNFSVLDYYQLKLPPMLLMRIVAPLIDEEFILSALLEICRKAVKRFDKNESRVARSALDAYGSTAWPNHRQELNRWFELYNSSEPRGSLGLFFVHRAVYFLNKGDCDEVVDSLSSHIMEEKLISDMIKERISFADIARGIVKKYDF